MSADDTRQPLSARVRSNVEAAPWVIEEIRALEAAIRHEADCVESARAKVAQLEAIAAEARRNDAIAMSWISEAKHAIGYEGDMPGFIEALRARPNLADPSTRARIATQLKA